MNLLPLVLFLLISQLSCAPFFSISHASTSNGRMPPPWSTYIHPSTYFAGNKQRRNTCWLFFMLPTFLPFVRYPIFFCYRQRMFGCILWRTFVLGRKELKEVKVHAMWGWNTCIINHSGSYNFLTLSLKSSFMPYEGSCKGKSTHRTRCTLL